MLFSNVVSVVLLCLRSLSFALFLSAFAREFRVSRDLCESARLLSESLREFERFNRLLMLVPGLLSLAFSLDDVSLLFEDCRDAFDSVLFRLPMDSAIDLDSVRLLFPAAFDSESRVRREFRKSVRLLSVFFRAFIRSNKLLILVFLSVLACLVESLF